MEGINYPATVSKVRQETSSVDTADNEVSDDKVSVSF